MAGAAEEPFGRPWQTCSRCNYDMHRCPGCGESLPHGTEVCADCALEHAGPLANANTNPVDPSWTD